MITETIELIEGRDDVTLTACVWGDSPELLKGKARPAVLICPGGGYFSCSDREAEPVAFAFAAMGYHAFVLRYSVYGGNPFAMDLNNLPLHPESVHPNPVRDIGRAMLKIRERAEEWHVDTERIAICGFSAGAHNCAMYASYWATPVLTDFFRVEKEKLRPAAAILGYCISDYLYMREKMKTMHPMDQAFFAGSNTAFLGEDQSDERLDEVSPARHVNENNPPTFLWATAADMMVPVQHTIKMAHALADCKIPFELHVFEEGPHGLSVATDAAGEAKTQVYPDVAKWVGLCDTWLKKRFALPLLEKTAYDDLMFQKD